MPHPPTTRRERQQADLERRVDRVQGDRRFQFMRGRRARIALVVASAACCAAIIPAFAWAGSIAGIAVTLAAWAGWWALRVSVRQVADLPDRFLDERQRSQRDRSYLDAFRIYSFVVSGLATLGLVWFVAAAEDDIVSLSVTWDQAFGLAMFLIVLAALLPSMSLAWREPGERDLQA